MKPYPIEDVPARPAPQALDVERIKASLARLEVGKGFVIPALEIRNDEGELRTTKIGRRIHVLAKMAGIRVSTLKVAEGLRVRREK